MPNGSEKMKLMTKGLKNRRVATTVVSLAKLPYCALMTDQPARAWGGELNATCIARMTFISTNSSPKKQALHSQELYREDCGLVFPNKTPRTATEAAADCKTFSASKVLLKVPMDGVRSKSVSLKYFPTTHASSIASSLIKSRTASTIIKQKYKITNNPAQTIYKSFGSLTI